MVNNEDLPHNESSAPLEGSGMIMHVSISIVVMISPCIDAGARTTVRVLSPLHPIINRMIVNIKYLIMTLLMGIQRRR